MAKLRNHIVTQGSGNVFADLGLPNAEELGTKVRLFVFVNRVLDQLGLTPVEIACLRGVSQLDVLALRAYKVERFSALRLMHFVTALEHDVVIEIRPKVKAKREARVMVVSAG